MAAIAQAEEYKALDAARRREVRAERAVNEKMAAKQCAKMMVGKSAYEAAHDDSDETPTREPKRKKATHK